MLPSTLGLIFVLFADPKARGIAVGVWAGGISAGVALGPLLSGLLLEAFGWQSTFLVAVPVMALVAIGAPLLLPEHKDRTAKIDLFSALLLVTSLLGIIYSIKRFIGRRWDDTATERSRVPYNCVKGRDDTVDVQIRGRTFTPQEISAMILQKLKVDAESFLGEPVEQAVSASEWVGRAADARSCLRRDDARRLFRPASSQRRRR